MISVERQLSDIFRNNPNLYIQLGHPTTSVLVTVSDRLDSDTSVSIGVMPDLIELTKVKKKERVIHTDITIGELIMQATNEQLPLSMVEVLRLTRLGLEVEGLCRLMGGGWFIERLMPEVNHRLNDLTTSHGYMYVNPEYTDKIERVCQAMRRKLGIQDPR